MNRSISGDCYNEEQLNMVGSTDRYSKQVETLAEWLKTQHHLPQSIDKILLLRFIIVSYGDLDCAKKWIDKNYTMRNNNSHIYLKRDPCNEATQQAIKATDIVFLPNFTPDGYKVLLSRLADFDPNKFEFNEAVKVFFMFTDTRFITEDPTVYNNGEVAIFDMNGFTLKHLAKFSISTVRIYTKFNQEASPIQMKAIHLLNCPSYLDKVLMVVKPFLKSEVYKLLHFHLPGSETIFNHIPKEMFPNEYGGQCGEVKDIKSRWVKMLKENRDYLANEKYWKIDEKKRGKSKLKDVVNEGLQSLSID